MLSKRPDKVDHVTHEVSQVRRHVDVLGAGGGIEPPTYRFTRRAGLNGLLYLGFRWSPASGMRVVGRSLNDLYRNGAKPRRPGVSSTFGDRCIGRRTASVDGGAHARGTRRLSPTR